MHHWAVDRRQRLLLKGEQMSQSLLMETPVCVCVHVNERHGPYKNKIKLQK